MSREFPLIIADESVDARIIHILETNGYPIYSITTESPGVTDSRVIEIAVERNAFIITEDKDFGDELVYRKVHNVGSLLLRINTLPIVSRSRLVLETFMHHSEDLKNCFSVLTPKKLRIRKYS